MKLLNMIRRIAHRVDNNDEIAVARSIGVSVGENCVFNDNARKIFNTEPYLIKIGNHVEIAEGVRFLTHEGGVWVFREKEDYRNTDAFAPIVVGNNVMIGMYSIIMPGVTIADNVIIGANSVITHDVPAGSVFAGNPARQICGIQDYLNRLTSGESKKIIAPTKGLSNDQKRDYLMSHFPKWFE